MIYKRRDKIKYEKTQNHMEESKKDTERAKSLVVAIITDRALALTNNHLL